MLPDAVLVPCVRGAPKAATVMSLRRAYVTSCTGDVGAKANRTEGYRPKIAVTTWLRIRY
jgi:hypothetical protein